MPDEKDWATSVANDMTDAISMKEPWWSILRLVRDGDHPTDVELGEAFRATGFVPRLLREYFADRVTGRVKPPRARPRRPRAEVDAEMIRVVTTYRLRYAAEKRAGTSKARESAIDRVAAELNMATTTVKKRINAFPRAEARVKELVPLQSEADAWWDLPVDEVTRRTAELRDLVVLFTSPIFGTYDGALEDRPGRWGNRRRDRARQAKARYDELWVNYFGTEPPPPPSPSTWKVDSP